MWNLTDNTNELIYKAEIDSQTWKIYDYQRRKGEGMVKLGLWDKQIYTIYI